MEAKLPKPVIPTDTTVPILAPKVPCAAAVALVCSSVAFNKLLFTASLVVSPAILVSKAVAAALPSLRATLDCFNFANSISWVLINFFRPSWRSVKIVLAVFNSELVSALCLEVSLKIANWACSVLLNPFNWVLTVWIASCAAAP